MRNIIIFTLVIYSLFLASCKEKHKCPEQIDYKIWNGQNFSLEKDYPFPICITWQFRSPMWDWKAYKSFSQGTEIGHIIKLLDSPEIKESRPELQTSNKLTLFFPIDVSYNYGKMIPITPIRIVELYFDVNDGEFICPAGKSKVLGKIFTDKYESGQYVYRFLGGNYSEKWINTYIKNIHSEKDKIKDRKINTSATIHLSVYHYDDLDRTEKTLEFIREEERKFKEKYGINDPNQP